MRVAGFFVFPILFLAACAPMSQVPNITDDMAMREAELQREIVFKEYYNHFDRLQNVSRPILRANTSLCGEKIAPYFGVTFRSLNDYQRDFRNTAHRLYGIEKQPTIYYVAAKSPSDNKLKPRDVILKINDKKIKSGEGGLRQIDDLLSGDHAQSPVSFIVKRGDREQTISVQPEMACRGKMLLDPARVLNAFADGENIIVSAAMMDFTKNDHELALVIGHELAHNTRNHIESGQANQAIGTILGAVVSVATGINVTGLGGNLGGAVFAQGFEAEADYVGLYHTARAGYDIAQAPHLWRRMAAANPAAIDLAGSSHPSTAKRFLALEMAVKEINAKKSAGRTLAPEEKDPEKYKKDMGKLNE